MADTTVKGVIIDGLAKELSYIESRDQNLDSGAMQKGHFLSKYTNRVFGAPFQLLDSVDKRFDSINLYVGNEYLRNFILNTPILTIRPGLPKYTGNESKGLLETLGEMMRDMFGNGDNNHGLLYNIIAQTAKNGIFGYGAKLQKRMFGFRETYNDYCNYANYMCRSVAKYLKLTNAVTDSSEYPNGTFTSLGYETFDNMRWENYRLRDDSVVQTNQEYFWSLISGTDLGAFASKLDDTYNEYYNDMKSSSLDGEMSEDEAFDVSDLTSLLVPDNVTKIKEAFDSTTEGATRGSSVGFYNVLANKITSVQFMVEPTDFGETYTNTTKTSAIESAIDGVQSAIGSEIGWITNSDVDGGIVGDFAEFIGQSTEGLLSTVNQLTSKVTGGFASNLFSGAIRSLKGQKMIYPKIYESSSSENNYRFTINLKSPYGDKYNYYMNIVVPWLHILALTAPRMITANSTGSPFIVQAYIPGMATVQLGIIRSVNFQRNPEGKFVTVNGFPNSAKVEIEIEELYNSMAVSPASDPASFMYNETLNDYLCNMSGLIPSLEVLDEHRRNSFEQLENYVAGGGLKNDFYSTGIEYVEDFLRPY